MKDKNIYFIGFMASGKSTVSRLFHQLVCPDYFYIDSDAYIENAQKHSVEQIFEKQGEAGFREIEACAIHQIIQTYPTQLILATGGGSVMNQLTQDRLKKTGIIVYLSVDIEEIVKRLNESQNNRPLALNRVESKKPYFKFLERFEKRRSTYKKIAHFTVNNTKSTPSQAVDQIKNLIVAPS